VLLPPPPRLIRLLLATLGILAVFTPIARADLGIVVADPTNLGNPRFTTSGHSLVYLSGVCPASPVHARLCHPGEQGSVVSMYPDFHEAQPYAWNLVPFSLYLYGSLTPGSRLLYASKYVKQALELHTRESLFQPVCAGDHCPQIPHSYWRDMVAATADRDLFLYAVHTTPAQDKLLVDWLNHDPNQNRYNALTNNCANFTSTLVNAIFPHSVHRDLLNDVGLMGPKAAARSFTLWALKHPELDLYTMHFAQQPGDIRRSGLARSGTETVIHMKKYLIPAIVFGDFELPTSFFAAYIFTGRFGLYKQFSLYPSPAILGFESDAISAKQQGDTQLSSSLQSSAAQERARIVGTPQQWASYRERFASILQSPEARNLSAGSGRFFPQQYGEATASVDPQGHPWLTLEIGGTPRRVGIRSDNLLSLDSDPEAAFQLMLGRIGYVLAAKNHLRETIEEFHQDWSLLEQTQARLQPLNSAQ
jgi:hypothetical protein